MNALKTRSMIWLVCLGAVFGAYFAGGVSGFGKGLAAAEYSESGEAGATASVLRCLRSGDDSSAIGFLESRLDSLVLANNGIGRTAFRSWFNLPRLLGIGSESLVDQAAAPAISYRAEYPTPNSKVLGSLVAEALGQLQGRVETKR